MSKSRSPARERRVQATTAADLVLGSGESTVLDVLDNLLNKGVVLNGDLVLGVAGVDLVYLRLSALLCAVDRVMPEELRDPSRRRRRHRKAKP